MTGELKAEPAEVEAVLHPKGEKEEESTPKVVGEPKMGSEEHESGEADE